MPTQPTQPEPSEVVEFNCSIGEERYHTHGSYTLMVRRVGMYKIEAAIFDASPDRHTMLTAQLRLLSHATDITAKVDEREPMYFATDLSHVMARMLISFSTPSVAAHTMFLFRRAPLGTAIVLEVYHPNEHHQVNIDEFLIQGNA